MQSALAANKAARPKLRIDSTAFQHAHYNAIARDRHAFLRHHGNVKKFRLRAPHSEQKGRSFRLRPFPRLVSAERIRSGTLHAPTGPIG
jgi:hypothetical protein